MSLHKETFQANNETAASLLKAYEAAEDQETQATALELGVTPQDIAEFTSYLHEPSSEVLSDLRERATQIVRDVYSKPLPEGKPTPYYSETHLTRLPEDQAVEAMALHLGSLELFNHSVRQKTRRTAEQKPYQVPAQNHIPVMEKAQQEGEALAFDDLAFNPVPDEDNERTRTSRNALLAGLWTKVGDHARLPWCGSSMPVCTGDPWALATSAQAGMLVMIPRDAHFSRVATQVECYRQAVDIIQNPLFRLPEGEDHKEIKRFHQENIGATIEPNPVKGYQRAKALYEAGCRTFRIYGPEGATREMLDTLKALRYAFGNEAEIFVGQVLSAEQALLMQKNGASGLYAGVGGGGICDTPGEASVAYMLPHNLYEFRQAGVNIPYIAEAGVGRNLPLVLGLGGSAASKSGAIYGGTIESPGGFVYMVDGKGYYKPYAGEASAHTKSLNGKLDRFGKPMFIEGVSGVVHLDPNYPSVPYRVYALAQGLATALVFERQRTPDGLRTSQHTQIWRNTLSSSHIRSTHHI